MARHEENPALGFLTLNTYAAQSTLLQEAWVTEPETYLVGPLLLPR